MAEQEKMKRNQTTGAASAEVQSEKELELIQELVSMRRESNRSLEYEHLSDYRMPPRTHFAMLNKPAVSIKYGRMTFNMAAIRMFEGTVNILPMLHEGKYRLAAVPCTEEESASVEWSRKNKQGKWTNKEIRSEEFVGSIFRLMKWDPKCRYKVLGQLKNSDRGLIFVFDLEEAICYEKGKEKYTNPATGEVKERQIKHYPDYYNEHVGRPYNDYEAARQMNQFEDTGTYTDGASMQIAGSTEQDRVNAEHPADQLQDEMVTSVNAPQQITPDAEDSSHSYRPMESTGEEPKPADYYGYFNAAGNE